MAAQSEGNDKGTSTPRKRTRVSRPYPVHTLEDALAVADTIQDKNAGLSFDRVLLAKAMGTTPASSSFTQRLNSSAKYGLTSGGYSDERISLTPRGASVATPTSPEDRLKALLDAALEPEPFRSFYRLLDGKRLPEETYARNLLGSELGVQPSLTEECLGIIVANGLAVGLLGDVGGSLYVSLSGVHSPGERQEEASEPPEPSAAAVVPVAPDGPSAAGEPEGDVADRLERTETGAGGKIFVGHAGNSDVVEYLREVLDAFGIPYLVVDSDYDTTRPLAAEVAGQMRECTAAILVFAAATDQNWIGRREEKRADKMLYQLGAASALYGDRIVAFREVKEDSGRDHCFHTLEFRHDRFRELGLAILAELHRLGIVSVTA